MNRKWWKLIFLLPICLCLLYAGGYTAQFIRNYQVWSAAGNFAGNGTYPQAPSPHPQMCLKALTFFPYNLYGIFSCLLVLGLLIFLLMRMGYEMCIRDRSFSSFDKALFTGLLLIPSSSAILLSFSRESGGIFNCMMSL